MMIRGSLVVATCALAVLAVPNVGCTSGECGAGTVRYGDTCVGIDPFDKTAPEVVIDPPLHTREVGTARLTSDEPAMIYYTIDGSAPTLDSPSEPDQVVIANVPDNAQLRYFAVDLAGNQSAEGSRIWIIDRDGPGAPLEFRVAVSGPTRTITWTPPPDPRPGGVLVARVEGQLSTPPIAGQAYAVGDTLSPGVTIVELRDATTTGAATFTESMPALPGMVRYVAWAYDNLFNYGVPAADYTLVPIPAQTGQITVDAATESVTVVTAPSALALSGTATLTGTTLTLRLSVRNDTTRVLFTPKVLLTSTLTDVTWSNADGALETVPYRHYGAAIMPGTSATASWVFAGAASDTSLTLDLDLRDGYAMTGTTWDATTAGVIVDAVSGLPVLDLASGPAGQGGDAMTQRGGITPDGQLVVGARTSGTVSTYDLSTGQRVLTSTLRPQKSHTPQVLLDRSGAAAYALVAEGHPNNVNNNGSGGSDTVLVRLDTATLTENGRIELGMSRNRDINLSPDGRTLLIATGVATQGVIVVDLTTFAITRRILPGFRPQCALFTPNGESIVVVGEQIAIFSAADGTRGTVYPAPSTPTTNGKIVRAALSSPTQLWIGRRSETSTIDLATGTNQVFPTIPGRMLEVFDGKLLAGSGTLKRYDATGTEEATLTGFTSLDGHWIGRSPF